MRVPQWGGGGGTSQSFQHKHTKLKQLHLNTRLDSGITVHYFNDQAKEQKGVKLPISLKYVAFGTHIPRTGTDEAVAAARAVRTLHPRQPTLPSQVALVVAQILFLLCRVK